MTLYEKELARIAAARWGHLPAAELIEKLCHIGVIDHTLCKILAVRRYVDEQVRCGSGKIAAMWLAAEHFCATYEYVRKCMYYYNDVNLS
jgi:hypothetical protein